MLKIVEPNYKIEPAIGARDQQPLLYSPVSGGAVQQALGKTNAMSIANAKAPTDLQRSGTTVTLFRSEPRRYLKKDHRLMMLPLSTLIKRDNWYGEGRFWAFSESELLTTLDAAIKEYKVIKAGSSAVAKVEETEEINVNWVAGTFE